MLRKSTVIQPSRTVLNSIHRLSSPLARTVSDSCHLLPSMCVLLASGHSFLCSGVFFQALVPLFRHISFMIKYFLSVAFEEWTYMSGWNLEANHNEMENLPRGQRAFGMNETYSESLGFPGVCDRDLVWLSLLCQAEKPTLALALQLPGSCNAHGFHSRMSYSITSKMCSLILNLISPTHPNWYYLCRQSRSGKKPKCTQSQSKVSADYIRLAI